jgi:hypothetical protein
MGWTSTPSVGVLSRTSRSSPLDSPAAQNATLKLGGLEALSPLEVVRIFEEVGGRAFEVQHIPEEALQGQQEAPTDPMQQSFVGLMRCVAQGDAIDMQETLRAFPVQLTSVRDYVGRVLATSLSPIMKSGLSRSNPPAGCGNSSLLEDK